ncbi:substrate-binding domain-containing protein [Ruania alba]|uniref:Monosaccharide ABC transporter substrate-binding protein, CUT2 family n=1 Tax=Ruania alba TaxID=648782 RepID=A0A1H5CIE2_9MICO|nr:substrate-binding domain-containing protein [Ruania alba]SED66198.1 monosaccharide ABC transporter substrate-binding protein, CUT2 family [Ruania alba]
MNQRTMWAAGALVAVTALAAGCTGADAGTNGGGADDGAESAYTYTSDQDGIDTVEGVELAAGGPVPDGSGETIAVVLKALTNQYWQGIELGVNAAAEDFDVDVTLQAASSESAQNEQLTIAQTMVNQGYDAYILAPESTSNLTPAIETIMDQGAPIVNVDDARIAGTVYVGPDHTLNGTQAADYIAQANPDGGPVAQIEGQAGSSAATLRIAGYTEGVEAHDDLELVASVPGNWSADEAFAATNQILQQHPDLVGIYANNDTMAIGVAQAVAEAGLTDQITIVGTDGVPEAISGVRSGSIEATVSPLPYYEGYWAVEAAVRMLRGEEVAPWVVAPAQLIDAENVDEFYTEDGLVVEGLYE